MPTIANPLYDTVFKHLMAEERLACKVLSTILGKKVIAVQPMPQEVVELREKGLLSIRRMDYRATISDENGRKEEVHIEVQKSRLTTNTLRFRSYLSRLYAGKPRQKVMEPAYAVEEPAPAYGYLPIIVIYLLGYGVRDIQYQAVRANHRLVDLNTGQELEGVGSDFLDALTHTTYIIQANRQPQVPTTALERLLVLFDQRYRMPGYGYFLELPYVPQGFEDVVQCLEWAAMSAEERAEMEAEYFLELEYMEMESLNEGLTERIERLEEMIEAANKEQELARQREAELRRDKEEARRREEEARRREEEARRREEEARKEKEEARRREEEARRREEEARLSAYRLQIALARTLLNQGLPIDEIARATGLGEEEVRALQEEK